MKCVPWLLLALAFGVAGLLSTPALSAEGYGLERPKPIGPFLNGRMPELGPGISGNWSAVVAFPNLAFKNALGLLPVPGTTRLAVWEREGRIWTFDNRRDSADKKLVLDISRQCQGWDDSGLLGLAFHPDVAKNHYVFVWYAWVPPGTVEGDPEHRPRTDKPNHDRLSRFTLDANGVAVPGSELVFIDQETHVVWHKGGGMFFHPKDGFLYITVGDDEDGSNSQRIDHNLLGGLLRIDVDKRGGQISHPIPRQPANGHTDNYFIPNGNPFVGKSGVLEEFYGIGLRSPHRMTHDAVTGRTFIGDVGDSQREEIDVIEASDPPGLNFQWPIIEGLRGDLTPPYLGVNKRPIIDYDHGDGSAVIGGFVYRGKQWADDLGGRYIFGDNGNGRIWALDERTAPVSKLQLCTLPFGPGPNSGSNYTGLSSFGFDADGELYLCQMSSHAGQIYRLQRDGPPPARKPFPRLLSRTGAFTDTAKLVAAPGLVPYTVNSPLWSDGAVKSRWMALPDGGKIGFAEKGEWSFPNGTVFVKHFELPIDETHPQERRRLETRLLVRDASGSAYGVTYKWRPDNSDADLVTESVTEDITIHTAAGTTRKQAWYFPSQNDCMQCHTLAAGYVLGPKTRQLNGDFTYATGAKDNQLRAWNHLGLFNPQIDEAKIAGFDKLVAVADATAPLDRRVRSYLDSNCAQCHRPGGVHALWDARYDTPIEAASIVNGRPVGQIGIPGAKVVKPGDAEHSLLFRRVNALDPILKMPPLARNLIDPAAAAAIGQWVAAMPAMGALPKGWLSEDIGAVSQGGDAAFANGVYSLVGSGADIWDNADGFQFVHQPLHGDGRIIARVAAVGDTDGWAKAGVMIRETTAPDAKHATAMITHDQGAAFQRRAAVGSASEHTAGPDVRAPYWVMLERKGNAFTASVSPDGQKWQKIDQVQIPMAADVRCGLAITAHNAGAACPAVFDHVTVQAGN
jgi:uncharacterized repeat protein (TIGR03806 family)